MSDWSYDPTVEGGPEAASSGQCHSSYWAPHFDPANGPIDWVHANSVASTYAGGTEYVDLSFKQWNQVVRVNTSTGAITWTLSSEAGFGSLSLAMAGGVNGTTDIAGQHAAYATGNTLQLFDNEGQGASGSRVLRLELSGGPPVTSATIIKSWQVVDATPNALVCSGQGSGFTVPGTTDNVLALCNDQRLMEELTDTDGITGSEPPLIIQLASDPCTSYGPANRTGILGWYRAFPLVQLGEF